MNNLKEIFPFLLPFLTAIIGYIFVIRTKKVTIFYEQLTKSLQEITEPLYLSIRKIKDEKSAFIRDKLIEELFEKFISDRSGIFRLGNRFVIEWFLETEKLYRKFRNEKNDENFKGFWTSFEYLYLMIENEYWNGFSTLYRDYRWFSHNFKSNVFLKLWYELIRFMRELVNFSILLSFLLLFYAVYEIVIAKFSEFKPLLPDWIFINLILFTIILIMFYGLLMILSSMGPNWTQKKSILEKLFKLEFNKQLYRSNKFERNIKFPDYY